MYLHILPKCHLLLFKIMKDKTMFCFKIETFEVKGLFTKKVYIQIKET